MSADARSKASTPALITLEGCDFAFVASLIPDRDAEDAIVEVSPQGRYAKRHIASLHKHGHGTFCRFHIPDKEGWEGVYALMVEGSVRYIGSGKDLGHQFSSGYGHISPASCYEGGNSTYCKINHRVLKTAKAGGHVDLYFHPTPHGPQVKKHLLATCSPPWNGRNDE